MIKTMLTTIILMMLTACSITSEIANYDLQQLQQALAVRPNDPHILNAMGLALYKSGNYSEAEPLFLQSLAVFKKIMVKTIQMWLRV